MIAFLSLVLLCTATPHETSREVTPRELALVKAIASGSLPIWRKVCKREVKVYTYERRSLVGKKKEDYRVDVATIHLHSTNKADLARPSLVSGKIKKSLDAFGTGYITFIKPSRNDLDLVVEPGVVGKIATNAGWIISIDESHRPHRVRIVAFFSR